ncbi:MAG: hypothetical protein WC389_08600, partial [Lutibacter sp.]
MSKKINYTSTEDHIIQAVEKANFVLESDGFHQILSAKEEFGHSNATGLIISNLIKNTKVNAYVEIYKSVWPWSKVNGYTLPTDKNKIYLNERKFNGQLTILD